VKKLQGKVCYCGFLIVEYSMKNASPEACEWGSVPATGDLLVRLPRFPQWLFAQSAMDVRSLHGCGAAGEWPSMRAAPLFLNSILNKTD